MSSSGLHGPRHRGPQAPVSGRSCGCRKAQECGRRSPADSFGSCYRDDRHLDGERLGVAVVNTYEAAPAGEIECEIVAASICEVAWKVSDDNPRGECLRLRLRPAGNYAFVFCDVPLDWGRMLEAVRRAADASSDFTPEQFVGCRVRVVLKHYTAKDGSTRAAVAKWLPAPVAVKAPSGDQSPTLVDALAAWERQPEPAPLPRARPSRNAPPQYGADDDIPF